MRIDLWLAALTVFMCSVIRGFTQREGGQRAIRRLWCGVIMIRLIASLNALGDSRDLTEWFALWQQPPISHVCLADT